jgi:hypothetical protein
VTLTEGGTAQVGVRLAFAPAGTTTVNLASLDTNVATVSPGSLTFNASNYTTEQPVTVTAVQDNNLAPGSVTVRAQILAENLTSDAAVSVNDDDTQFVQTQLDSYTVTEQGQATIRVRLGFQPSSNTTVTLESSDNVKAAISPTSLTFSSSDWNTYKDVILSSPDDDDVADHSAEVTASAPNATGKTLPIAVDDNDTQEIVLSSNYYSLIEGETTDTINIHLRFRPSTDVDVVLTPVDPSRVSGPATIHFTTQDFGVDKQFTLTSLHDDDIEFNQVDTTLSLPGALDKNYRLGVVDDDKNHFIYSVQSLTVNERGTATVGVHLSHPISQDMTPLVYTSYSGYAETVQTELTFTPQNWNVDQTIEVRPVLDDDNESEAFNVICWHQNSGAIDLLPSTVQDTTIYLGPQSGSFPTDQGTDKNRVIAIPWTAASNINVERLAMEGGSIGNFHMALYTDNNGRPGTRIDGTSGANNSSHVSLPLAGPRLITAGTKGWIAFVAEANWTYPKATSSNTAATQCMFYLSAFSDGLPATWPAASPNVTCNQYKNLQVYGIGVAP